MMRVGKDFSISLTAKAFVLITCLLVTSVRAETLTPPDSLQAFWTAFRHATLADSREKVVALTHFPFKTRGATDWDPILQHDKAWLSRHFSDLLAIDRPILTVQGNRNVVYMDTMLELIERTVRISGEHWHGGDSFLRLEFM